MNSSFQLELQWSIHSFGIFFLFSLHNMSINNMVLFIFFMFSLIFILPRKISFILYHEFDKGVMGQFMTNLADRHSALG